MSPWPHHFADFIEGCAVMIVNHNYEDVLQSLPTELQGGETRGGAQQRDPPGDRGQRRQVTGTVPTALAFIWEGM